jgi:hypothetical protein
MVAAVEKAPEVPQKLTTKVVQKETSNETQKASQMDQISNKQVLEKKAPKKLSAETSTLDQSSGSDNSSESSEEEVSCFIFFELGLIT